MKVFFIGLRPLESLGGDSMEAHVVAGLKNLGIDVGYFSLYGNGRLGGRVRKFIELAMTDLHWLDSTPVERSLLVQSRKFSPDVVLVLLGNYTPPSTIQKVRDVTHAPVVCWCQDHMGTMGRQYILGSGFDYLFAKDQLMVDKFRRYTGQAEVHYLPEACNPDVHTPVTLTEEDIRRFGCEITTAGTLYYFRAEILSSLSDFDMKIWGSVPAYMAGTLARFCQDGPVYMRDKSACFNAASIVINTLFPMEVGGLNARAFEVAGCGGFQLIFDTEALARHFEPGKEIETFSDLRELREKVNYYLTHEDERNAIAAAGRRRAHADHTYIDRLRQMFATMGMELPESGDSGVGAG